MLIARPQTKRGITTLTIRRQGKFAVITNGPHHCGAKPSGSLLSLQYTFICKCDISALDDRGFLFDQTRVDQFFQERGPTKLSCELLAVVWSRALFKQIVKENPNCRPMEMSLELSPEPFMASITINWNGEVQE